MFRHKRACKTHKHTHTITCTPHTHTRTHTNLQPHTHTHKYKHTVCLSVCPPLSFSLFLSHTHTHTILPHIYFCTHTHTHTHKRTEEHSNIYTHARTHTITHTHTHTHKHTHTHTHTRAHHTTIVKTRTTCWCIFLLPVFVIQSHPCWQWIHTSNPRNPPSWDSVTRGQGSNHSGDVPSRFFRLLIEDTVTAPEHRARMMACGWDTLRYSSFKGHGNCVNMHTDRRTHTHIHSLSLSHNNF